MEKQLTEKEIERRRKISETLKGRKHTKKQNENISKGMKSFWDNEENRKKASDTKKAQWKKIHKALDLYENYNDENNEK